MSPFLDALDAAGSLVEWQRTDDQPPAFGVANDHLEGRASLFGGANLPKHWSLELSGLSTQELCAVLLALRHPEGGAR